MVTVDQAKLQGLITPAFARAFMETQREVFGNVVDLERSGLKEYDLDPVRFSVDVLGHKQWEFQKYLQRAVIKHRFVIVSGPRKNSKTQTLAELALAFMCTGPTICLTTSGSHKQVEFGIWQKIRSFHAEALVELPGDPHLYKWEIAPEWYALGFSSKDPGTVLGFHAGVELEKDCEEVDVEQEGKEVSLEEALLAIKRFKRRRHRKHRRHRLVLLLDEVFEIPAEILTRLMGSASGDVYVVAIGNNTKDPDSKHPAVEWMKPGSPFHRIHVSGEEFPAEWEPVPADKCFHSVPEQIQPKAWREMEIKTHGIDSPYVRCFVYGLAGRADMERALVPRRMLNGCKDLVLPWSGGLDEIHIGVDIGAGGNDPSVAALWRANTLCAMHEWDTEDLMASVGIILELMREWGINGEEVLGNHVHLDSIGVGKGPFSRLRQLGRYVDGVDFGMRPRGMYRNVVGQQRFPNIRAEIHWCFRRLLDERMICVPDTYREVWQQSGWYSYDTKGSSEGTLIVLVEDKAELQKLYGRSPDHLDAALYGLCRFPQPKITFVGDKPKDVRSRRARLGM